MAKRKMRVIWVPENHVPSLGAFRKDAVIYAEFGLRDPRNSYVRFVESPAKKARKKR